MHVVGATEEAGLRLLWSAGDREHASLRPDAPAPPVGSACTRLSRHTPSPEHKKTGVQQEGAGEDVPTGCRHSVDTQRGRRIKSPVWRSIDIMNQSVRATCKTDNHQELLTHTTCSESTVKSTRQKHFLKKDRPLPKGWNTPPIMWVVRNSQTENTHII